MKLFLFLTAVLFVLSTSQVNGQDIIREEVPCNKQRSNPSCDKGWGTIGLVGETEDRFGLRIGANIGRNKFWKISFQGTSTLFGANQRTSLSFLGGYSFVDRIGRVSFSAGPAIFRYEDSTPFGIQRKFAPGLSFGSEIGVTPISSFGAALEIFASITHNFLSFGAGFSFVLEGHK
ncbi:MAG: hypothetical protein JJ971_11615 [Balneolaceae bacterium]|nr:hypothetical protein [Balneolaceae bacterium]MBO6547503.1 hypothetical protein [Balneolaceae bacterium]MBO6647550.1 hypothetical protein [Balneolaceae bacterium]